MIKKIYHKKTQKIIWIVLTILILPAFFIWGSSSLLRNKPKASYVGVIDGKKVTVADFEDALLATRNLAIMQFGEKLDELKDYLDFPQQAWERLLLLREAKKRKINIADKEVIQEIQDFPFLQRKGSFDNVLYNQTLEYNFRTPARVFEEQIRQNLILAKLYKQVIAAVKTNDEELLKEYKKENEKISIYYLAGLYADFAKTVNPAQEELQEYYRSHAIEFKQPPSYNIEYVAVKSDEEAKSLYALFKKTKSLKAAGNALQLDVKESGFFAQGEPIPGFGWSPEITALIAKLNTAEIAPVVRLESNYFLFALKEKREPFIPELDKIQDKVKEAFTRQASQHLAKEALTKCLAQLQKEPNATVNQQVLARASARFGLKEGTTPLFTFGSYIEGVGASDVFFNAARNLKANEWSNVIENPAGCFLISVKRFEPIDSAQYQAQKEAFGRKLLAFKQHEYFAKFLESLKSKSSLY
ncbi:MAG: peptidylprolyl isomerase [Candidatus Omnitrophota bacterium]